MKNFQIMFKIKNQYIPEVHESSRNVIRSKSKCIIVKFLKTSDKKFLKAVREKGCITFRGTI